MYECMHSQATGTSNHIAVTRLRKCLLAPLFFHLHIQLISEAIDLNDQICTEFTGRTSITPTRLKPQPLLTATVFPLPLCPPPNGLFSTQMKRAVRGPFEICKIRFLPVTLLETPPTGFPLCLE